MNSILILLLGLLASGLEVGGQQRYTLPEERPPDYYLGNVAADTKLFDEVKDDAIRRSTRFSFLSQGNQYAAYFRITSTTSELYTASPLTPPTSSPFTVDIPSLHYLFSWIWVLTQFVPTCLVKNWAVPVGSQWNLEWNSFISFMKV